MTPHPCQQCGEPVTSRKRKYCGNECYQRHLDAERRDFLAELAWIADTDTWDNIAHRLGSPSREALEKRLQRMGEYGWANRVHDTGMPRTYLRAA